MQLVAAALDPERSFDKSAMSTNRIAADPKRMMRNGIGRKPFEREYLLPTMWSDHISGARTRTTSVESYRRASAAPR